MQYHDILWWRIPWPYTQYLVYYFLNHSVLLGNIKCSLGYTGRQCKNSHSIFKGLNSNKSPIFLLVELNYLKTFFLEREICGLLWTLGNIRAYLESRRQWTKITDLCPVFPIAVSFCATDLIPVAMAGQWYFFLVIISLWSCQMVWWQYFPTLYKCHWYQAMM